jgi:hypothetical protein
MSQPPYHLRTNKAADRFALIEAVRRLERLAGALGEYTYYGLGGAYLEDIRLLYEFYPEISMVSIEENGEIWKRQEFHRPCAACTLHLENNTLKSFIATYDPNDRKGIFWLDYTGLEYTCFEDFITLLRKMAVGSMVKITLRAHPWDYWTMQNNHPQKRKAKVEQFPKKFGAVIPDQSAYPHWSPGGFADLLQKMLQIAAQHALPAEATPLAFHPVSSFYYSDSTWMFTLTGVLWPRNDKAAVERAFDGWAFANLTWANPTLIDIPDLSAKERLHLQQYLPCTTSPGATLRAKLGHLVQEDIQTTEAALNQYATFHRYFPYFLRGVP